MSELKQVIKESMIQYAGAVLQSRALVDVRDCLKPSARQIFYCLYTDKFLPNKPFKKTLKAIGSAARMYIHGDSSCEGVIMRAGQPFAMRYPLIEVEGNEGNLMMSGNWAAPRYTASRLSEFSVKLFKDIDKETISDWRDNYDDTEKYPSVLPSKGFYNIVNGSMGIGIGAASSIPQFNIKDVNNALETLLTNPDCSFEDIYCPPDFATGAILLNEREVKKSLQNGNGFACKLRSVIEYDKKEKCFIVTEIPYGVYTNTICGELEKIIDNIEENPGVDRFNDLTGITPLIKIYLSKSANPDKVLKYLYKNTSLQHHFGINLTVLDQGRYPKVFSWKEVLQAHINHEKDVYRHGFEFDLKKIKDRIHIINGLLICLASIDEVIKTIKESNSTADASANLISKFLLDSAQAKAVLAMRLSSLAKLEVKKLENEKAELEKEAETIERILNDEKLFNNELIKGWRETAKKFGDGHRTKIMDIESENEEPVDVKGIQVSLTNKNCLLTTETSSLYTSKRGNVGQKFKFDNNEYVVKSINASTKDTILFFTKDGKYFCKPAAELELDSKTFIQIPNVISISTIKEKEYILFFTKNGYVKKSKLEEYSLKRSQPTIALTLDAGDAISSIVFTDDEKVGLLTERGQFNIIETKGIRPLGRIAKGIIAIKLNDDDYLCAARIVKPNAKEIVSVSGEGYIKRTDIAEFSVHNLATKGTKIQKLDEMDWMADFMPIDDKSSVTIAATSSCIKIDMNEVPQLGRNTIGIKSIKLKIKDNVISLC